MKVPSVKDPKLKEDFPIVVDLTKNQKGEWIGTFGMPEIGVNGFPLANLVVGQSSVSFTVPDLPKPTPAFDAKLSPDGKTLSGTLTTGPDKSPVSLKRTGEAKVALPSLPAWTNFMKGATASRPVLDFSVPIGIVQERVDPLTGYKASPYCPVTIDGVFPRGMEPTEVCPVHKPGAIPATDHTMPEEPDTLTDPND